MQQSDPFLSSLISKTAVQRVAFVFAIVAILWLAIYWAVSLP